MVVGFTLVSDNKTFRFAAVNKGTYKNPRYEYTCNNRSLQEEDYMRNLAAFKKSRAK